jgi:hypothetical protein
MEGPRGRRNFKQGLEAISGIGGPGHLAMQYAKARAHKQRWMLQMSCSFPDHLQQL